MRSSPANANPMTCLMTRLARRQLSICSLFCALALASSHGCCEWGFDTTGGFTYDDNLSNGFEAEDRKGDTAAVVDLSAGLYEPLGTSTALGLSLLAHADAHFRYTGLDNLGLGARAQLRRKFGLGPSAPWLAIAAQGVYHDYQYNYQDGWQYEAGATLGTQLNERWSLRGIIRYDAYVATKTQPPLFPTLVGSPYDVYGWNFGAQTTFLGTSVDRLSLSYTWRTGTVTSVTPPDEEILEYSDRAAPDPVFGSGGIAYRIDANTQTISLAWSHSLGRRTALNLLYAYRRSQAESDLGQYYANVVSVTFTYSY
jgi:hypothetical protein